MGLLGRQETEVNLDNQVLLVPRELLDQQAIEVHRACREILVQLARKDLLAHKVRTVNKGQKVTQDQQVRMDPRDLQDRKVNKDSQVSLVQSLHLFSKVN